MPRKASILLLLLPLYTLINQLLSHTTHGSSFHFKTSLLPFDLFFTPFLYIRYLSKKQSHFVSKKSI